MANKEIERKIAVIFATDVVGYSKSVEVNEEQTIKNFRAVSYTHLTLPTSDLV